MIRWDLRDEIIGILNELCEGPDTQPSAAADRILDLLKRSSADEPASKIEMR
jgi:hypothetical protein